MTGLKGRLAVGVLAAAVPLAGWGLMVSPVSPFTTKAYAEDEHVHHIRIKHAIKELKEVREHLDKAGHDFGGHKVEAIKAVDEAISQLQLALAFDKD